MFGNFGNNNDDKKNKLDPMIIIKQLELNNMDLKSQLAGTKEVVEESKAKYNQVVDSINNFCKQTLEKEFALSQIGDYNGKLSGLNCIELLNYTADRILDQKIKNNDTLLKIINEKKEKEKIIEDLKRQITELAENKDLSKQEILDILINNEKVQDQNKDNAKLLKNKNFHEDIHNNIDLSNNVFAPPAINTENEKEEPKNIIDENSENKEDLPVKVIEIKDEELKNSSDNKGNKKDVENLKNSNKENNNIIRDANIKQSVRKGKNNNGKENNNIFHDTENTKKQDMQKNKDANSRPRVNKDDKTMAYVIDLSKIANEMSDIHWQVIECIGVYGLSEKNDIVKKLSEIYDITTDSLDQKVEKALNEIKLSNLITKERVNTGIRIFSVYSLSDTGKKIYKEFYKNPKKLVTGEKELLIKQHSSLIHGYTIKESAKILTELGYKNVSYDSAANKIELSNGDIYIPDIIGNNPQTGEKEYFEVEFVHHKQSDFDAKCNKMKKVTNNFHFIVTDVNKRSKLICQLQSWKFKMNGKADNINIFVTTTRNLSKNAWETEI